MKPSPALAVPLAWLLLALATLTFALPRVDDLGLYYDEAFLAQQARGFVEPSRAGVHPPSVESTLVAGRPFPIRNAAYLGSLKSQLLIPSLALFGASPFVLRATTLMTGLLAMLFCMLWVRRLLGTQIAIVSGVLVACDPSFHFFSQFEWGPFTSMLLCRGAGLYLLALAFEPGKPGPRWLALMVGAASLGLGVYSRVDFVVILAALALALLACRRELLFEVWREQRARLVAGLAVFLLTVSPIITVVADVLRAGTAIADRGGIGYRVDVLTSVLDGSHFQRLIAAGGLFDELFARGEPATAFIFLVCVGAIALASLCRHKPPAEAGTLRFLLLSTALLTVAMLAIPGAVRAHHMLNILPLPHVIVAAAGVGLWHRHWTSARNRRVARTCIALALLATLTADAASIDATRRLIRETGGKGRWSSALQEFVREVDLSPAARDIEVVSLDWGFHEPMLFTTQQVRLSEPIWAMTSAAARRNRFVMHGDANTVYLIHEEPYELFGLSEPFGTALRMTNPERYEVRTHTDRTGDPVFKSVRFDRPHELSFDGTFRIRLPEAMPRRRAPVAVP